PVPLTSWIPINMGRRGPPADVHEPGRSADFPPTLRRPEGLMTSEAPRLQRLLVRLRVVQRQVAGRFRPLEIGDHRRLRARAGDRREELGVFDLEPSLQSPRAAD